MAKKKISAFTEAATLEDTDILPVVINPATIPASRKITTAALRMSLLGNASAVTTLAEDGGVALADGTQITLEDLRGALDGTYSVYVPPSGDETGETDADNIQAALTALTTAGYPASTLHLRGAYYVDTPLVCGQDGKKCPCIRGPFTMEYTGTLTDDYFIKFYGNARDGIPLLTGGLFDGNVNCRGVLFYDIREATLIQSCRFYRVTGINVDAVRCYGSHISDIVFYYTRGLLIRFTGINGGTISRILAFQCLSIKDAGGDDESLWAYEVANGRAAAMVEYGADYLEYWPDPDDTTVGDPEGTYTQTAESRRGLFSVTGTRCSIRDCMFEITRPCEYPLIYLASQCCHVEGVYSEKNRLRNSLFTHDGTITYRGIEYSKIQTTPHTGENTAYLLHLISSNGTRGVRITDCELRGVDTNIVHASAGSHTVVNIENVFSLNPTLARNAYIGTSGSGKVTTPGLLLGTAGQLLKAQGDPATIADGDTPITVTDLQAYILTMASSTSGRAPTVPTGTKVYGIMAIGESIDWTFINTGNQTVTITANADHTLVGNMAIAAGTQKSFRTRCSAANTAITYALT